MTLSEQVPSPAHRRKTVRLGSHLLIEDQKNARYYLRVEFDRASAILSLLSPWCRFRQSFERSVLCTF